MSADFNKYLHASLWWIPLSLVLAYSFYVSTGYLLNDFANYYFGGYALSQGLDAWSLYDAKVFNEYLEQRGYTDLFVSYYPNTPFISTFFMPLSYLDAYTAKVVFNLFSIGLLLFTLYRYKQRFLISKWMLLLLPVVFYLPFKTNVVFGQVYFLLLFLIGIGYLQYLERQYVIAACLWSIAILLKVFPVVIFLWLLWRKDFEMAIYLIVGLAIGLFVSMMTTGVDVWVYYLNEIFPKSNSGVIYDGYTARAKSCTMLIKNLFSYDAMLNPDPVYDSKTIANVVSLLYKVFILAMATAFTKISKDRLLLTFGIWIMAALLLGPTSSTYSQCLLIIPMLGIWADSRLGMQSKIVITIMIGAVCNVPLHLFYDLAYIPLRFPRALLMITLMMYIIIVSGAKMKIIYVLLYTAVLGTSTFFRTSTTVDYPYAFPNLELPICITQLGYNNNEIYYDYRTATGIKRQLLESEALVDSTALRCKNNQIYYGDMQLTHSDDHKQDPLLLDDNIIIFLSDQHRGIGFYTIRMISLSDY